MRSAFLTGIVCAGLLAGCQAPAKFNPEDPAVIAAIESRLQAAMQGSAQADAEQVVADLSDDATFITSDVMLNGRDNIRTQFADTYSGVEKQTQTVREKRVRILSPDVAAAPGRERRHPGRGQGRREGGRGRRPKGP